MNTDNVTPVSAAILPDDTEVLEFVQAIQEREQELDNLQMEVARKAAEVKLLRERHTANTPIKWREASLHCLEVDKDNSYFFLKTSMSVVNCIAKKYAIDVTKEMKSRVPTTLSNMFKAGLIGRVTIGDNTYYGMPDFFQKDLITLKKTYEKDAHLLRQVII